MRRTGLPLSQALRHLDGLGITQLSVTVDMRAAGVREAQQTRDLVEALPRSVIQRGADHVDMPRDIAHMQQRRVSTGHDQRQRILRKRPELQLRDGDMPDDMIDAVQRLVRRPCKRFGTRNAHGETSGEAGARRHRYGIHVAESQPGVGERLGHARHERLGVRARGDFRNHAAITGVLLHRRGDDVGTQRAPLYDCSGGFVACRFDAQYDRFAHGCVSCPVCFVMSPAADVSPAAPATPPLPLNPTMRGSRSSAITYASMPSGW